MNPKKSAHRSSQFRHCSNKTQMTKALREKLVRVSQDQNEDVSSGNRRRSNGALWRQHLSCASHTILRVRKTADRRIVQAHGTTDLRETIAVLKMSSTNGFIPPYSVG